MRPLLSAAVLRSQTDARLVALARDGHEQAFATILNRYRRELHAHARRVAPVGRSEDVVQQAALSAWSALGRQTEVQDLRSWLHRIVHNAALRVSSGIDDHDELHDALAGHRLTDIAVEQRFEVREALVAVAALPERQRRAFEMTALGGASGSDAAAALGVSEGTLRQLVHRARTALRSGVAVFIPGPLVSWAAATGSGDSIAGRVAELSAGAGLAVTVGKVCATVAVTASIVGGATQILHRDPGPHPPLGAAMPGVRRDARDVTSRAVLTSVRATAVAEPTGHGISQAGTVPVQAAASIAPRRSLPTSSPGPRPSPSPASGSPLKRSGVSGRGDGQPSRGDGSASPGDGLTPSSALVGGAGSSENNNPVASTVAPASPSGETASADERQPPAAGPPSGGSPSAHGDGTESPTP